MGNHYQILLLATSATNKLDPLTNLLPAPMVPLANKPVMEYPLELLARQGFKQVFVSLYHMANQIEAYFGSGQRWGLKLNYILQQKSWGTAGAMKWAQGNLKNTVIVIPGDTIVDVDIPSVLDAHFSNGNKATMVVSSRKMGNSKPMTIKTGGEVTPLVDSDENSYPYYNTGVYVFESSLLNLIPNRTYSDIQDQFIPSLLDAGIKVTSSITEGYWNPLNTFEDYQGAQQEYLLSGQNRDSESVEESDLPSLKHPFVLSTKVSDGVWVGRSNIIHPNVKIAPPVIIGDHCRIGQDVEIGPEVVIGSNVVIDDGASIKESTIIDNTYVGKLVNIENRIVYQNTIVNTITGDSIQITDHFLLGPIHQTDIGRSFTRISDLLISLILLVIFLPLMTLIGILVFLSSGRVFQTFNRAKNISNPSESFNLIRFHTRKKDIQPTLMGRWIEALEFHRLPELYNVLKGDMQMVGVKPLTMREMDQILEEWQRKRFECPAGITGLWYIKTNQDSSLDEVLVSDAYYVATRNWREDIKLMGQTLATWFRRNIIHRSSTNQS